MKKYLLILSVVFVGMMQTTKAQNTYPIVPRYDDFEIWYQDPANGSAMDPDTGTFNVPCWLTLNPLSSPLIGPPPHPVSVFKDSTTVHSGKYSCRVLSVVYNATAYNYIKSFIPHDTLGALLLGTLTNAPSIIPGYPYTHHISSFTFWYQYAPQMNAGKPDTASCAVVLTRLLHGDFRKQIASGRIVMNNTSNTWVQGTVNLTYDTAGCNPDTIQVIFASSSLYKPAPGSTLILDGVSPLGVDELVDGVPTAITVYPNPASAAVNFSISGAPAHAIDVYDITGKKVNTYPVKDFNLTINTSSYPTGIYLYKVYNKSGEVMKTGKFNINN
jgi:hypothetical protein